MNGASLKNLFLQLLTFLCAFVCARGQGTDELSVANLDMMDSPAYFEQTAQFLCMLTTDSTDTIGLFLKREFPKTYRSCFSSRLDETKARVIRSASRRPDFVLMSIAKIFSANCPTGLRLDEVKRTYEQLSDMLPTAYKNPVVFRDAASLEEAKTLYVYNSILRLAQLQVSVNSGEHNFQPCTLRKRLRRRALSSQKETSRGLRRAPSNLSVTTDASFEENDFFARQRLHPPVSIQSVERETTFNEYREQASLRSREFCVRLVRLLANPVIDLLVIADILRHYHVSGYQQDFLRFVLYFMQGDLGSLLMGMVIGALWELIVYTAKVSDP